MFRFAIASALLLGAGSIAGMPATSVVGTALAPAPQSRAQADADIDDATAAALIGTISSQFDERSVQVRLGKVRVDPAGIVQRVLEGSGQVRIGRDPVWIPFHFRALYDIEQASVGSPEMTLGGDAAPRALAKDDAVAKALDREVGRRLHREFADQTTSVQLDGVQAAPAGGGYLRLEANGVARFDREDTTTRIHALYDPRNGEWLQLAYELGVDRGPSGNTVAAR